MAKIEKRFKVGDTVLWYDKGRYYNAEARAFEDTVKTEALTVTAVGRRWVTTTGGKWSPYKFDEKTGRGDAFTPGTIFKDEADRLAIQAQQEKEVLLAKEWARLQRYISSYYSSPPVGLDTVYRVGTELGMKDEDWKVKNPW